MGDILADLKLLAIDICQTMPKMHYQTSLNSLQIFEQVVAKFTNIE